MFKFKVKLLFFVFSFVFFMTSFVFANSEFNDVINMNTSEYGNHTKGIVIFNHSKHNDNYGIECGECHHDNNNKPISLEKGDEVSRCILCHVETAKPNKDEKLSKKDKIKKYHKAALHGACKSCHRKFNKSNNLKKSDLGAAPQDCKGCHPKKK